jgi:two-component system, OmpR family, sensor histidine kinase QseC
MLLIASSMQKMFGPSLMRRLALSQLLLTAVLWVCALFWLSSLLKEERLEDDFVVAQKGAAIAFELAAINHLTDAKFAAIVKRFDEFQQNEATNFGVVIFVHREGRLIYATPNAPVEPKVQNQNEMIVVSVGDKRMNYFQKIDEATKTRFSVLTLSSGDISFTPWSKGILFAPLVMIFPFVFLPALLSIWLALRPWREVSREVAMKGPQDLSPLAFAPKQHELKPMTKAINQLLEKLRLSSERERRFVADAAHELRTPLASIRVLLQTLAARPSCAGDAELIQSLLRSSDRASRLVVQLLALMRSDIDNFEVPVQSIDLVELLQARLADFSPLANQKRIDLELEVSELQPISTNQRVEAFINADLEGLTSLVDNLIENAIKYSPTDSQVRVRIQMSADNKWVLTVQDYGEGIAPEHRQRVFERFFRAPDQNQAGSGLGLAIVKAVADRLDAEVTLGSEDAVGLKVLVKFKRS